MPTSQRRRQAVVTGVALLFACVLLFGVAGVLANTEKHSYTGGALPPNTLTLKQGGSYQIAIHGGVKVLTGRGVNPTGLQCEWSSPTAGTQLLDITPESGTSKATNTIATFVSPVSGSVHIDCIGVGPVFVDDAANASPDLAGLFLVLAMVTFGVGLMLLFGARVKFQAERERSAWTGEDEEIERLVHLVHVRSEDVEVGRLDGPDGTP